MFAELHHKASVTEDVLTSNVLGAYAYLPFELGLRPLLELVRPWDLRGQEEELERLKGLLERVVSVEIHFWPRMDDRTEPDAVAVLQDGRSNAIGIIGVEAKHGAGMQSYSEGRALRSRG